MSDELVKYVNQLVDKIGVTADCRFAAAKRLDTHNRLSLATTTIVALVLVFISSLQLAGFKFGLVEARIVVGVFFLNVFVLVMSVVVAKSDFSARRDRLFECARRLKQLQETLRLALVVGSVDETGIKRAQMEYDQTLSSSENHKEIDYLSVQLSSPDKFPWKQESWMSKKRQIVRIALLDLAEEKPLYLAISGLTTIILFASIYFLKNPQ